MICEKCGKEMKCVHGKVSKLFVDEQLEVENIEHYECSDCGTTGFDLHQAGELSRNLVQKYRKIHGMLGPDEIRALRAERELSVEEFSRILGVSKGTVSKWEDNVIVQRIPENKLMQLIRDHDGVLEDLALIAEVPLKQKHADIYRGEYSISDNPPTDELEFKMI